MSNNSLFEGQLQRRSNHERVALIFCAQLTDEQYLVYFSLMLINTQKKQLKDI